MFLGNLIRSERLKRRLTQAELASGICTQYTISKIEKHSIPPTADILAQICLRLNLTLDDVFSDFTDLKRNNKRRILLSEDINLIETELLRNNFTKALKILDNYDFKSDRKNIPPVFYLWESYIGLITDEPLQNVEFYLMMFSEMNQSKFTSANLLYYNILGIYYEKSHNNELASVFFQKSFDYLVAHKKYSGSDIHRLLFSVITTVSFYKDLSDLSKIKRLLTLGIDLLHNNVDPHFANIIVNQKLSLTSKKDAEYKFLISASKTFLYLSK